MNIFVGNLEISSLRDEELDFLIKDWLYLDQLGLVNKRRLDETIPVLIREKQRRIFNEQNQIKE
jgi:hypothetical protein